MGEIVEEYDLYFEPGVGTGIKDAIKKAWFLSVKHQKWVRFGFNGLDMKIHYVLNQEDFYAIYQKQLTTEKK